MDFTNGRVKIGVFIIGFIIFAEILNIATTFLFPISTVWVLVFDAAILLSVLVIIGLFRGKDQTVKELRKNRKRLKNIFDTLDVAIWAHDLRTDTLLITTGIEKLYGHSSKEFQEDYTLWKKVIHPDDLHVLEAREQEVAKGNAVTSVYRIIRPDGEVRWIQDRGIPTYDETGKLVDFNSVLFDITDRKESEDRYRSLVEMSPDVIAVYSKGKIEYINEAGCKLFRAKNINDLIGQPIAKLIPTSILLEIKANELTLDENIKETMRFEFQTERLDGTKIDLEMSTMPILYEGRMAEQIVARDISQRKKAEKTIKYMAYYDALTGLPNRNMFRKHLNEALKNKDKTLAVLFLDLDRFKIINDTKGHSMGDLLLKSVAQRLKKAVQEQGMVSRQGGDEFIILLENIEKQSVVQLAEKILQEFSKRLVVDGQEFYVTPSIGISLAPEDGEDEETLIKHADTAMYLAKEHGKNNFQFYTSQLQGLSSRKMELENGLRKAIEQNQLVLQYQPQVDLDTGKLVGVEALLRWQHPELGVISPSEFIPLAEETGQILKIGEWVLRCACKQNKAWQELGFQGIPIGVNTSVRQMQDDNFIHTVIEVLDETGLDPKFLELEITESIMQNIEKSTFVLNQLKTLGVKIAIDDFGTGYSSLSYLNHLPIDRIKIDKSFVDNLLVHTKKSEMVKTIIDMGHNLKFEIVAEGVETADQVSFLKKNGCKIAQGYFYSGSLGEEEMKYFLEEHLKQYV